MEGVSWSEDGDVECGRGAGGEDVEVVEQCRVAVAAVEGGEEEGDMPTFVFMSIDIVLEVNPGDSHQSSSGPGLVRVRVRPGHCFGYDAVSASGKLNIVSVTAKILVVRRWPVLEIFGRHGAGKGRIKNDKVFHFEDFIPPATLCQNQLHAWTSFV